MRDYILNAQNVSAKLTPLKLLKSTNLKPFNTGASESNTSIWKVVDENNRGLIIRTSVFSQSYGNFIAKNGTIPIDREDDEHLYNAIIFYEGKINELLQLENNTNANFIRSTYKDATRAGWFKTSKDLIVVDWSGKKLPEPFEFGCGRYQMAIRAYYLYHGPHGNTEYKYSVLFKVVQIRFKKEEPELMFDFDDSPSQLDDEDDDENKENRDPQLQHSAPTKKKPRRF